MEEKFNEYKNQLWPILDILSQQEVPTFLAQQYEKNQNDIIFVAAFVTVINHKSWYWHEHDNKELSQFYANLYYEYSEKAWDWLDEKGTEEEKNWYFHIMD